jgi:hypothetical protein
MRIIQKNVDHISTVGEDGPCQGRTYSHIYLEYPQLYHFTKPGLYGHYKLSFSGVMSSIHIPSSFFGRRPVSRVYANVYGWLRVFTGCLPFLGVIELSAAFRTKLPIQEMEDSCRPS